MRELHLLALFLGELALVLARKDRVGAEAVPNMPLLLVLEMPLGGTNQF